jgi:hypothetical protein
LSYDLYLTSTGDDLTLDRFSQYFASRPNFRVEGNQAWYQNEDTGTYFVFEYDEKGTSNAPDDEDVPLYDCSFNLNYYRPTVFATEAEPELRAFIETFSLTVDDPQIGGMGVGQYQREGFLEGWLQGNEFAYESILGQSSSEQIYTLPTIEIERIWLWNLRRAARQVEVGDGLFVPRIVFLDIAGAPKSAVVWPDGIPSVVPSVDLLIVPRQQLAPRRLFSKTPDRSLVTWQEAEPILRAHASLVDGPAYSISYRTPPAEVVAFIKQLKSSEEQLKGIAADTILNAELVAKYSV